MNVLSYLNVTNIGNLEADSGFIFQKLLLTELEKRGHTVYLLAPKEAMDLTDLTIIPLNPPKTKYHARYQFDWDDIYLSTAHLWDEIDLLLINQPEIAPQFKAMVVATVKKYIPIVCYVHYLPFDWNHLEGKIIYDTSLNDHDIASWVTSSIRTGIECADACIIGSNFAADLLLEKVGKPSILKVIPPPIETNLINIAQKKLDKSSFTFRILYNHRLYAHYGTEQIFDWLDEVINESDKNIEVIVTHPNRNRAIERKQLDNESERIFNKISKLSYVRIIEAKTRDEYHQLIESINMAIAPYRGAALWNMSIVDILASGLPVIAPNLGAFKEILYSRKEWLFTDKEDFKIILSQLILSDMNRSSELSTLYHNQLSISTTTDKFEKIFMEIIN